MSKSYPFRFIISYDGTAYRGWQIQQNLETIQGVLETALSRLANGQIKLHGSGRTDRGVHAMRQTAHCLLPASWEPPELQQALNSLLPADIRVLKVGRTTREFHARRSAVSKEYRYLIWNDKLLPPFLRYYRMHVRVPLNLPAMRSAAALLEGRHDFAAFTANPNRLVESTIRELYKLQVTQKGKEICITACANGFLYKMVRSLAGFLIQAGIGAVPVSDTVSILNSRERTARVPTAPAQGLFLWRVSYKPLKLQA